MTPQDHIEKIRAAVHELNMDGHIVEPDEFVAVTDLYENLYILSKTFECVESLCSDLAKSLDRYPNQYVRLGQKLIGEISAGEVVDDEKGRS